VNAPRSVSVFNISPSPHRLQTVGALVSGQPQNDAASIVKMSPEELRLGQSSAEKKEETKSKNSVFWVGKTRKHQMFIHRYHVVSIRKHSLTTVPSVENRFDFIQISWLTTIRTKSAFTTCIRTLAPCSTSLQQGVTTSSIFKDEI
jgi:hypothetical protein